MSSVCLPSVFRGNPSQTTGIMYTMPTMPPTHKPASVAGTRRHGDSQRDKPYDRVWRRLRLAVLSADPLCAYCAREGRTTLARVVDHIVPVRLAPHRRLDPSNLQPLCTRCHVSIKAREERATR